MNRPDVSLLRTSEMSNASRPSFLTLHSDSGESKRWTKDAGLPTTSVDVRHTLRAALSAGEEEVEDENRSEGPQMAANYVMLRVKGRTKGSSQPEKLNALQRDTGKPSTHSLPPF
ncbi:hypothetical protein EYF80_006972 [Liparis tanakae]|uniref:Uncharacterized protein n=1 Tax=Liparis tanakae TaxID=230148 RepID=A0A4Z2IY87_9TELE|nr:hypothetical protein EYF80_006972 [Liparis tanakae]